MDLYQNINWELYIKIYKDLFFIKNKEEAITHWNNHGQYENRKIYKIINDFDWIFYKNYYNDLNNINTKEDAIIHWYEHGINENRIYNNDILYFDWEKYLLYYDDLLENNINKKEDVINHFIKYGKNENRKFFKKENLNTDLESLLSFKINIKDNKPFLKVRLSEDIINYYLNFKEYYSMISLQQFINYFLPKKYNYIFFKDKNEICDIAIWHISLENNSILKDNEINMLISIENMNYWNHYKHYNLYKNYGNKKMNIYLYNHITEINKTDTINLLESSIVDKELFSGEQSSQENTYISIPTIHFYINYFILNYNIIKPIFNKEYANKKFCLMINKSKLNNEIEQFVNLLNNIDKVDNINMYDILIKKKSCYHSEELITIFNKYKFVLCIENSYDDGYITEKIFNCLFAYTIPIYKGSKKIKNYIDENRFIDLYDPIETIIEKIRLYNTNEKIYNEIINYNIISKNYNNENYENELTVFIDNKLYNNKNILC
jgi:hypothetical protein